MLKATTLNGAWKNGTLEYTLYEGELEWDTGSYVYEDNNSGREWSILGGDGSGCYILAACPRRWRKAPSASWVKNAGALPHPMTLPCATPWALRNVTDSLSSHALCQDPSLQNGAEAGGRRDAHLYQGQHRAIASAGFDGSFVPILPFEKLEIHPVFLRFSNVVLCQTISPGSLAELRGDALTRDLHISCIFPACKSCLANPLP